MDTGKINQWLILGANVGVLVGLVLVVLEINQATVATKAEMLTSYQGRWIELNNSMQDLGFAGAWAKAIERPDELTTSEMIQVGGFLWAFVDQINLHQRLWELGVFDETVPPVEAIVIGNTRFFFGNAFAQSWWAEYKDTLHGDWVAVLNSEVEKTPTSNDLETIGRIRERIGDLVSDR